MVRRKSHPNSTNTKVNHDNHKTRRLPRWLKFPHLTTTQKIMVVTSLIASLSLFVSIFDHIENAPHQELSFQEDITQGNKFLNSQNYQKAIDSYDAALEIFRRSPSVLRSEGLAYLDWGINNATILVKANIRPPYSYAKSLIDYCGNSSNYTEEMDTHLFDFSYQCFSEAATYSPSDPELMLYKGISALYCFPSSACDPIKAFNETLTYISTVPTDRMINPLISIRSDAEYGLAVAYLKIGLIEKPTNALTK